MANLHRIREMVLLGYANGLIDDEEFVLLYDANRPANLDFNYSTYEAFDLGLYNDDECKAYFRFKRDDILHLKEVLQIPESIQCRNGTRVNGLEALCVLLARFAYPCRYGDLVKMFGRSVPQLCLITKYMIDFVYDNYAYLLGTLNQPWLSPANLTQFAAAVTEKGGALHNCWGFVDGTVRPICRPNENQRVVYNGHKRVHALKYQNVSAANGMIANLFGPIEGRRHDSYMLRESGLLHELEQYSHDVDGNTLCIYGDPAYPIRAHLQSPFKGNAITPEQEAYNRSMSSVRVSVEWLFGDIVNNFKFTDFKKNQKIGLSAIGKMYLVSGLLTNAHTCLYGNITSRFFGLDPPTLMQYFHGM
ncbi:uncharacterized protein [Diadema setosum]|uniref:uncharacterized protein n=1 Tax=Diadema setosum TaxID=31175 RepID=UPI003B3B0106